MIFRLLPLRDAKPSPQQMRVGLMLAALALSLCASFATQAKPKNSAPALTPDGQQLLQRYQGMMDQLEDGITDRLPNLSDRAKSAYLRALEMQRQAKADLEAAQGNLAKIGKARGLVGHAKNYWIPKAEKNIAKAEKALAQAKTPAEREAAEQEIEKWKDNREAGEEALRERQAAYEKEKRNEDRYKQQLERAKRELERSNDRVAAALRRLRVDRILTSDRLDAHLAKYAVLKEATPRGLAAFAQQGSEQRLLIERLLADEALLIKMQLAGGAEDGHYGRAMRIYSDIRSRYNEAKGGDVLQRLALAVALEHATPIKQRNPKAATDAPEFVDPVKRYGHFRQAYLDGELDPYFKVHDAWSLRFVVNGSEPDQTLAWGREMLRSYRPDHITTEDDRWRYVALVRTCVRYGSQENKNDKDELQFYQNILMNGGICGRRAFFGRFILRAFGVPTVAKPQTGHAALGRWTPDGWVPCLGAGWNTGWAPKREMAARDFLELTQARNLGKDYMQVVRARWIGDVYGEPRKPGLNTGRKPAEFWNSVALHTQKHLVEQAGAQALAAVGEELGEANESDVKYPFESARITEADRRISIDRDGVITIPAAATSSPTKSSGKVRFMDSNLGGKQLHYSRGGRDRDFTYTFDAPRAGTYELTMKLNTPAWKQHVKLITNGGAAQTIELPHTVGLWETTRPVEIELKRGKNELTFSRRGVKQPVAVKGFTLKHLTLTPVE